MTSLTVLYGSQSGTAERQAFRIARMALQRGAAAVRCLPADDTAVPDWPSFCARDDTGVSGHVVFVLANANQGEAPETYRRSWAHLLSPEAPCMNGLSYAVFGLGDSLYSKFNYMAKMTHNRLKQLGGQPLVLRGLGDESDAKGLDEALLPWLAELWTAVGLCLPVDTANQQQQERTQVQAPLDAKLFPLFNVKLEGGGCSSGNGEAVECPLLTPPPRREPKTFHCRVSSNRRLTAADHFQAVHHIELEVVSDAGANAVTYEVGDALGVYCVNQRTLVDYVLSFYHLDGSEQITVVPNCADGLVEQTRRPFFGETMSVRSLLTYYVDLEAVTEQDFFWMMSSFVKGTGARPTAAAAEGDGDAEPTPEEEYRERLRELANPTNPDDFLVYSYREKRNVCEVLLDYNVSHAVEVRPPLDYFLSFVSPMRPRLFSLSSSPALDPAHSLALTVAQLDWRTPMHRHRHGMCSTALVRAALGDVFQCFVWEGTLTLPPVPTPLLLVATGSGVAPVRSLLRHCAAHSAQGWQSIPVYLFFGCRNAAKDFLYAGEWEELRGDRTLEGLTVIPAFSRDDPTGKKVYVQHKLGQNASRVGALLQPAVLSEANDETPASPTPSLPPAAVYVCGNAKNMPKDVQAVLQDIIDQVCCGGDGTRGQQFMKQMQREGRYQVDTWSA